MKFFFIILFFVFYSFLLKAECTKGVCTTGTGVYEFDNGDKYIGQFNNSEYDGKGTFRFKSGDVYIGQFKNGKLNGELYVFDSNGILIEVMIYKNGKYKRHTYFWNESLSRTKKNKKKYSSNPLIDHYIIKR